MRYPRLGLIEHDRGRATPGFTLFSPLNQLKTHIIDMQGRVVHRWDLPSRPAGYGYLRDNGNLLVAMFVDEGPEFGAKGGLVQERDWDGNVVWEHRDWRQHHDFRRMPNGNLIYLAWERMPDAAAARVQGGRPGTEHADGIWGDVVVEVDASGRTVAEWRMWEHIRIEDYPLGWSYGRAEFGHPNTLFPLPDGTILLCWRHLDMIAILDRKTGRFAWERREEDWGGPHDAQMLPNGNLMLYANRNCRGPWRGSEVIEFERATGAVVWRYRGKPVHTFDSHYISGCQRLWSGNTLICEGLWGRFFEVTPAGEVVWEYINPHFVGEVERLDRAHTNTVFRAYRYRADGAEIRGRLGDPTGG